MQPVDIYYSSSSITAPPPPHRPPLIPSQHMAQHYGPQCFAACKTFTLITNQQIYFCKVGAERAKSNKKRGMEAKFYRAVFVVLNFSETCWQACFSEVNITSSERVRGQIFSSTNDAHQREGAGRMTHALRRKPSERRPASQCKINVLLFNASSSIVDADMEMFSGQTLSLEKREAAGGRAYPSDDGRSL